MRSLSRRDFLRTASAAALGAGATFGSGRLQAAEPHMVNGLPASILGRTGLKVTKISFGSALTTEPHILSKVIDAGINFVHTSPGYQNGRSMDAFGKVFKDKKMRGKVVLALKERPEKIDKCLKVLNTDYVDILVPPLTSVREITDKSIPEEFEKVKKAGKAGYMGWSGHRNTTEIFRRGVETGWYDATLMSYSNIKDPAFLKVAREANEAGIGIFTMKGLPKRNATGATEEEAATFTSLCSSMVNRQYAHSVLVSMGSFQSVDFFRNMMETRLGYYNPAIEERYWVSQQGNYCAMCGACEEACPDGDLVPSIVRFRMYYKDYGLREYARGCYARLGRKATDMNPADLELCESVCTRELPLRHMLQEAHELLS